VEGAVDEGITIKDNESGSFHGNIIAEGEERVE
jgi:hypothetical protein